MRIPYFATACTLLTLLPAHAQPDLARILNAPGINYNNAADRARVVQQMQALEDQHIAQARARANALGMPLRYETPTGSLVELAGLSDGRLLYHTTNNVNAAISTGANLVQTSPYNLDGTGFTVGVWDGGSGRSTHQEFATGSRMTNMDGASPNFHAMHCSGTIGAAGVVANSRGMANNVLIDNYDWNSDTSEMTSRAASAPGQQATKVYISSHSYSYVMGWDGNTWTGTGTDQNGYEPLFGQYAGISATIDSVAYNNPYYLSFWAAGNERSNNPSNGATVVIGGVSQTYNSSIHPPGDGVYMGGFGNIGRHGCSKNGMAIGAVNDAVTSGVRDTAKATVSGFTSWGPADDGRIKPDIVANGVGLYSTDVDNDADYRSLNGTSMATPNASGSATLLVDHYSRLFPGQAMRSSTLKALIIHTADDIYNAGPDYKTGWGLMNTKAAADLLSDHQTNPDKQLLTEDQVSSTVTTKTYDALWDGSSPIRATLCWTDPAGASVNSHNNRTPDLVNDLDIKIIAPDSTEYFPFVMPFVGTWTEASANSLATTGVNHTDNVEQVLINAPAQAGVWQVVVSFTGTLTNNQQDYGLILTGVLPPNDDLAPTPDPMTWASAPAATGDNSITMTATTATDMSGVEYYFTETSGTAGGSDSGWQDSPTYTDTGLFPGTQYTYTVTARDKSANQNATAPSTPANATTTGTPDTSPPLPNPPTFASFPVASSTTSIIMTATTATDPSGVEYYFTETSGNPGGSDSGWQDSPTYEDTGLNSGTAYTYTVSTRDKGPNQNTGSPSAAATAYTDISGGANDLANADIAVSGTVTGTYTNTQASDNSYQQLTEEESSGGAPSTRHSFLEHKWSFNVTAGDPVTFHLEAHHTANSENDDFTFAYSTTGADGSYTDMLTVTKTSDDNTEQTYVMPAATSGVVHVRAVDTDQTSGNNTLDSLFIDSMYFSATTGADSLPPTLVSISDDQGGGPIEFNTPVTYTVTFSEDMDDTTVTAADFDNAGTATVSFGAVTETSPGVFTVAVTPTTDGTLQLRLISGSDLRDAANNAMDTTSALLDDVTITVTEVIVAVTLGDLSATYDGSPHPVSVTTDPTPVAYTVTYDGSSTAPTDAGSYEVIVTVTEPGYDGGATDTLVIAPAAASVVISDLSSTYDGSPKPVTVTTTPNGIAHSVTYDGSGTAPTNAGSYAVVATITDPNYSGSDSNTLVIAQAPQTITFDPIAPVYDNAAPFDLTATASSGLPVTLVNSNPAVVTLAGTTVTVVDLGTTTITASQSGDANYLPATSVDQDLTVVRANPLAVTTGPYKVIIGQSLSLDGSGSFPSYPESITNYDWDLNNDGTFGDVTGATPAAITFDDLMSLWGMTQGLNTIQLRVTDSSAQSSTVATTVELILSLQWDANATSADQTNGGGAWLGTDQWWDGSANTDWVSGSDAIFGGAATNGGSVTLAGPTAVNQLIINQHNGTYTLGSSGQTITINGGIDVTADASTVNIISPVEVTSDQQWNHDSGNDFTVSGVISGSGGFTKSGSGRMILSAAQDANSYSGNTVITGGILQAGTGWSSANNIPGGLSGTSGTAQSNLEINGGTFTQWYYMTRTLGDGPGQIQITGGRSGFTNRQGDAKNRNWRVGDDANYEIVWGSPYFNPSILVLQDAAASPGNASYTIDNKFDLNGAMRTIEVGASYGVISQAIRTSTGTAGITKTGAGILNLTNSASSWNGNTIINDGILDFTNINIDANIGAGPGVRDITVAANSGVRFNAISNAWLNRIVETSDEITLMTGATSNDIDLSSSTGANLPNAFLASWASNNAKGEYSGTITPNGNTFRLGSPYAKGTLGIVGVQTDDGATPNALLINERGGGCVILTAANTFSGDTTMLPTAKLVLGDNLALQNSAINTDNGTLYLSNGAAPGKVTGDTLSDSPTLGGLKGSTDLTTFIGNGNPGVNNTQGLGHAAILGFTLNPGAGSSCTYAGAIGEFATGTTLTKTGAGTQVLTGASTYTGNTTVSAGMLVIDGSLSDAASTLNVASGATLGGSGTVGRDVTIDAGGKLEFDISTSPAGHAPLTISTGKGFGFAGASELTITSAGGASPGIYTLVTGGNNLTGVAPATVNLPDGWTATVSISTNSLILDVSSTTGGYSSWTGDYPALSDPTPGVDFDGAGLSTGVEWVYGGDPTSANDDATIGPVIDDSDPATVSFTFRRADAAHADPNTTITVEYGSNLIGWTPANHNGSTIIFNETDDGAGAGIDLVEVVLSRSLAVGNKMFTRIKVDVTP